MLRSLKSLLFNFSQPNESAQRTINSYWMGFFCDIQNNQALGKGLTWVRAPLYQPKSKAEAPITFTENLIIMDIRKTESNNCFVIH